MTELKDTKRAIKPNGRLGSSKAERIRELDELLDELFKIRDKLNQEGGTGNGK